MRETRAITLQEPGQWLWRPDLESVRSQPKEKLLVAILDPNREVQPAFLAATIETTDGPIHLDLTAPASSYLPQELS